MGEDGTKVGDFFIEGEPFTHKTYYLKPRWWQLRRRVKAYLADSGKAEVSYQSDGGWRVACVVDSGGEHVEFKIPSDWRKGVVEGHHDELYWTKIRQLTKWQYFKYRVLKLTCRRR